MKVHAIIPAAGHGVRMLNPQTKKPFLPLAGLPILVHTLRVFQETPAVHRIVCVVSEADIPALRRILSDRQLLKVGQIVRGGERRQDSVWAAVSALDGEAKADDIVLVHDAVRPLVKPDLIERVIEAAQRSGAAIAARPVTDSLKVVTDEAVIDRGLSREKLWAAQTPQAFRMSLLVSAYRKAMRDGFLGTDEAALVTHLGLPVRCVKGPADNIKITTPDDLSMAERLMSPPADTDSVMERQG